MEMELIILQMEINTLDNIDMENHQERVNTYGFQEQFMKETLNKV